MIPKRVKQFYMNVTDVMKNEDYNYVTEILNKEELSLFTKLLKSEQKHCVRIAKEIEYIIDNKEINNIEIIDNKERLKKAALLHDIGKTRKKLNVIDKSIIVILNNLTKGELIKLEKSKKIQCYYRHSEYSYEILKDMIDDKLILDVARNHHKDNNNDIVSFFKTIDDKN
ncbi:HD domain-containing protein [Clostridium sp. CCUG 7971]|uniref:HD domain-containing protein n=1 Tax=Clostridium sp. CCUG 7971 TaxID=2811414 RepID=UPI001ABAEB57|nr:HD domain-containing protein [Clostridium sp. CCUG 7971]MBO3443667.1 HD domain-containing protein [Clostridium sp. CCUG 7971]